MPHIRMTDSERSVAIGLVLAECRDIMSNDCIVQTVLALGQSHYEIGEALWWAVDEARNNPRAAAPAQQRKSSYETRKSDRLSNPRWR